MVAVALTREWVRGERGVACGGGTGKGVAAVGEFKSCQKETRDREKI